jgi:predicted nucleic acid-binding protein
MTGNKGLLDSNVIIDAAKGLVSTQEIVNNYDYLYASIISYVETLGYNFSDNSEKEMISQLLGAIEIVDLNKDIANIAIEYRRRKKIKLPDALVLATAKYLNANLLTSDGDDFENIDSSVSIVKPTKK